MKIPTQIFLLAASVLLLAHYLPQLYWLLTPARHRAPVVFYSATSGQFLFLRLEDGTMQRRDAAGAALEREEFEALLPLNFSAQLQRDGRLPETILGREITSAALREGRFNFRVNPAVFDTPMVSLYPLLEADSGRVRLESPSEFVRFGRDLAILDPATNTVNHEKTNAFRAAFHGAGFRFPARVLGTNATTLKPYDEGFYLLDSDGELFHFQQKRGQPVVRKIPDPAGLLRANDFDPLGIFVQEQETKEFRCLIVGRHGELVFVLGPHYEMTAVPMEKYDPRRDQLAIRGDMLHRLISVTGDNFLEALVVDRSLQPVARHMEEFTPRREQPAGQLADRLFPFRLQWHSPSSSYLDFYFHPGGWGGLLVWLVVAGSLAFLVACSSPKIAKIERSGPSHEEQKHGN